ncbi:YjcZ family sporulation protein [Bacillus benzoevorans]|nr:YjcZ family sporulation protein [Bacillus benzoevorans]
MPAYTAPAYEGGYGYGCAAPAYGYGCCPSYGNEFILIVVLFILLIIVGACVCGFSTC